MLNFIAKFCIITININYLRQGMRILGETVEELKSSLYELMNYETIWCEGKVLSLSQKLDVVLNNYYLSTNQK
jgi:hypothetical protein